MFRYLTAALCGLLVILSTACAPPADPANIAADPAGVTPDLISQQVEDLPAITTVAFAIPTDTPAPRPLTRTPRPVIPTAAVTRAPALNGIPTARILVLSGATLKKMREVFERGQTLGRNPRAFSKVGDSTMVYPPFLAPFDRKGYNLGTFVSLQTTIDRFAGSFARESIAARKGMHTWSEFDPEWVTNERCESDEGPLACELRVHNPSIALIRLGANDSYAPQEFDAQLRKIVEACLAYGVIPVLGTKPDRIEGQANTLNKMVVQVASAYALPLWDYDLIAGTVPGKGLEKDGVHFAGSLSRDYTSQETLSSGDALEDLTGLMMLDAIRRQLAGADD